MFTELRGSSRDGVHRLIYDILISNYVLKTKDELLELTGSTGRLVNVLSCDYAFKVQVAKQKHACSIAPKRYLILRTS